MRLVAERAVAVQVAHLVRGRFRGRVRGEVRGM